MAIIGIDLGTTNCAVSVYKDAKSIQIPNRLEQFLTPFIPLVIIVVYYYATGYEYGHLGHDIAAFRKNKNATH